MEWSASGRPGQASPAAVPDGPAPAWGGESLFWSAPGKITAQRRQRQSRRATPPLRQISTITLRASNAFGQSAGCVQKPATQCFAKPGAARRARFSGAALQRLLRKLAFRHRLSSAILPICLASGLASALSVIALLNLLVYLGHFSASHFASARFCSSCVCWRVRLPPGWPARAPVSARSTLVSPLATVCRRGPAAASAAGGCLAAARRPAACCRKSSNHKAR